MEQQTLDIQIPTAKIYKDREIYVGTFLGGPLVAGYLIAENFKNFNEPDKARKTLIYSIIATIIIFGGIFLIPDTVKIPNQIIPLIYTGIAYLLVHRFQGKQITSHIDTGGQIYSWWRTIGVGLIGLAFTLIVVLGITFFSGSPSFVETSAKSYGVMKHEIDFDKNNITEREVDKLADGLTKTNFFDEAVQKFVYAKKIDNNYELTFYATNLLQVVQKHYTFYTTSDRYAIFISR